MPLGSQRQGLQALKQLECTKRIQGCTQISQDFCSDPNGKGDGSESVEESQSMITFSGIIELWKSFGMFSPVEFPRIDYDACNGRTMTTNPFRSRMYNDIGTMLDGSKEVTSRAKGIVYLKNLIRSGQINFGLIDACSHHQWNSGIMCHLGYRL